MKKFIEDNIELQFDSVLHVLQSSICMLLTAPFRLLMTISAKILYLPQATLCRVLLNSSAIAGFSIITHIGFMAYFGDISLLRGRCPVLAMIIALMMLLAVYFVVNIHDFTLYTKLEDLFPDRSQIVQEAQSENSDEWSDSLTEERAGAGAEAPPVQPEVQPVQSEVGAPPVQPEVGAGVAPVQLVKDAPPVQQEVQLVKDAPSVQQPAQLVKDAPPVQQPAPQQTSYSIVPEITENLVDQVNRTIGKFSSQESLTQTLAEMQKSTDPSEFLSQQLLAVFDSEQTIEDEAIMESLGVAILPNSFKVLA